MENIKIKKGKINFKNKIFKRKIKKIKEECEKIDQYSKIDPIKMLKRFDI